MLELQQPTTPSRALFVLAACVALLAIVVGCGSSEYHTPLPGGCTLYKIHGTGVFVSGPNGGTFFVPPDIVDFDVADDRYLLGRLRPPETDEPLVPNRPGYFLADTRSGDVQLGLDEAAWRAALTEAGIGGDLPVRGIPARYNTSPAAEALRVVVVAGLLAGTALLAFVVLAEVKRRQNRLGHSPPPSGT